MSVVRSLLKNKLLKVDIIVTSAILQKNGMSQWPSYYVKPVFSKEKQEELVKSGEAEKLSHIPIRAALNDQTSSLVHDDLMNRLINYCMKDGKKKLSRGLVEQAFANIKRIQLEKYHKCKTEEHKKTIELEPKTILHKAIENGKPVLELTKIKRGGVSYQVPVPITAKRSQFLSFKWLVTAALEKDPNTRFHLQLAKEIIDAANNTGRVVKRKQDLHKQCEANRAYAHYRWS